MIVYPALPENVRLVRTPAGIHHQQNTKLSSSIEPRKELRRSHCFKLWLRILLLDTPLIISISTVLLIHGLEHVYERYYVPLTDRSTRTDEDLLEEYTYYHRVCTAADLTSDDPADILIDTHAPVEEAVQQMQAFGAVYIPEILPVDVARDLREYVVHRGQTIPDHEEYPLSQHEQRQSFGYGALEHPSLVRALEHVANNPFLKEFVSQLTGDTDPAVSEITTITQFYGAGEMYWHADTKTQGNVSVNQCNALCFTTPPAIADLLNRRTLTHPPRVGKTFSS